MRNKFDGLIWGLILMAVGGLLMARNLGYDVAVTPTFWMLVFGALSALSFIRYLTGDLKRWGRLVPACLFAAFVVMIGLSEADVRSSIIGAPLFVALLIPFIVAVIADSQKNYWAVIPATLFGTLALATLLDNRADSNLFGAVAAFIMAAPFFFVYFTQPKQRWAIIPAGILGSIGLTALLLALDPALDHSSLKGVMVSLGFAATFGVLYLRRGTVHAEWSKYPAIVFSFIALLSLVENTGVNGGPLILIALGLLVLVSSLRPRHRATS